MHGALPPQPRLLPLLSHQLDRVSELMLDSLVPGRAGAGGGERVLVQAVCDLTDNQRVVGLHFLGPNAGEVS